MAYRYECTLKDKAGSGWSSFHTQGNGKPKAVKCKYCGGGLYVERGKWGVFVYRVDGTGDYRRENAVKLFDLPAAAEKLADANADKNYCVRWVYEKAEALAPGQRTTI